MEGRQNLGDFDLDDFVFSQAREEPSWLDQQKEAEDFNNFFMQTDEAQQLREDIEKLKQQQLLLEDKIAQHQKEIAKSIEADLARFECPIRQEIMMDPVITSDGFTYERGAIEDWLQRNNTDPQSRNPITATLIPNRFLKQAIEDFLNKHPQGSGKELLEASRNNNREGIVRQLFLGVDVNYRCEKTGATALLIAIKKQYPDIVQCLLASPNINVNEIDRESNLSVLQLAIILDQFDLVIELISHLRINVNWANTTGQTALHFAVNSKLEILNKLLSHKDIQLLPDGEGNTPLHVAARSTNVEIVQQFNANQFDYSGRNLQGMTALDVAVNEENYFVAGHIKDKLGCQTSKSNERKGMPSLPKKPKFSHDSVNEVKSASVSIDLTDDRDTVTISPRARTPVAFTSVPHIAAPASGILPHRPAVVLTPPPPLAGVRLSGQSIFDSLKRKSEAVEDKQTRRQYQPGHK